MNYKNRALRDVLSCKNFIHKEKPGKFTKLKNAESISKKWQLTASFIFIWQLYFEPFICISMLMLLLR